MIAVVVAAAAAVVVVGLIGGVMKCCVEPGGVIAPTAGGRPLRLIVLCARNAT